MRVKLLLILLNYHSNSHQWPLIAGLPAQLNQSKDFVSLFIPTVSYTGTEHSEQKLSFSLSKARTCFQLWERPFESTMVWGLWIWGCWTKTQNNSPSREKSTCVHQRREPPSCRNHGDSLQVSSYGLQSLGRGILEPLLGCVWRRGGGCYNFYRILGPKYWQDKMTTGEI